jgi:hypothetical protein
VEDRERSREASGSGRGRRLLGLRTGSCWFVEGNNGFVPVSGGGRARMLRAGPRGAAERRGQPATRCPSGGGCRVARAGRRRDPDPGDVTRITDVIDLPPLRLSAWQSRCVKVVRSVDSEVDARHATGGTKERTTH